MALAWSAIGILGLLAGAAMFALCVVVYASNPARLQVRFLALILAIDSVITLLGNGLLYVTDARAVAYAAQATSDVFLLMEPLAYLLFIGTLPSVLARPLASRAARWTLLALMPVAGTLFFLAPDWYLAEIIEGDHSALDAVGGEGFLVALLVILVSNLAGLVVGLHAWRSAPRGSSKRRQLGFIALAFGVRDSFLLSMIVVANVLAATGRLSEDLTFYFFSVTPTIVFLLFAFLLAYGVLKAQVFDIDLKIKWTLSRGTVATAFLLVFFVVSQLIERLASENLGYVSGAAAAGVLLLAINPLQKTADKLADRAMPKVQDTADYAAFRKLEVYKAAVEELAVGGISPKERRALDALRTKLGVAAGAASAMERDIVGSQAVA